MNSDNLDPVEMKNRWYPPEDPQEKFTRRDIEAESIRWELQWEEEFFENAPAEPPAPPKDKDLRKQAQLTDEQLEYLQGKYAFLFRNYLLYKYRDEVGYRWCLPYILGKVKDKLLKDFKTEADRKVEKAKAKAELAATRMASGLKPDGTPYEKTPKEWAEVSQRMKKVWAERKLKGIN